MKYDILGKCCEKTSEYLAVFNGKPMKNYAVLLCRHHLNQEPFNKNILSVTVVENKKVQDFFKEDKSVA